MQAGAEDERDAGDHQQDDEQRHQHHRHRVGQPEIIFRIKYFSQVPRQLYSLLSIICNLLIRLQWKHFSALLTRNTWELNAEVFEEKRKLFVSPLCSNICQWKIRSRRRRWAPQSQDNRSRSSSDHWSQQILSSRRSRESLQWSSLLSTLSTPAGGPSPLLFLSFRNCW